jgi:hypothetical protein
MMTFFESKTIGVRIARDWRDVYAFMVRPESFASWASGLGKPLSHDGSTWIFESAEGSPVTVRFTPHNDYGVLDHHVVLPDGYEIYIPLRVIANGQGAEVLFTLFRPDGMSDDSFAADAQWVERDLDALKQRMEAKP